MGINPLKSAVICQKSVVICQKSAVICWKSVLWCNDFNCHYVGSLTHALCSDQFSSSNYNSHLLQTIEQIWYTWKNISGIQKNFTWPRLFSCLQTVKHCWQEVWGNGNATITLCSDMMEMSTLGMLILSMIHPQDCRQHMDEKANAIANLCMNINYGMNKNQSVWRLWMMSATTKNKIAHGSAQSSQ